MARLRVNTVRSRKHTFRQRPKNVARSARRRRRTPLRSAQAVYRLDFSARKVSYTPANDNCRLDWENYYED